LVAHPAEDRYHQEIIPLGGGIAIFATISIIILAAMAMIKFLAAPGHLEWLGEKITIHTPGFLSRINQLLIILFVIFVLFALGLWDDKKPLGPIFKLVVQFVVAMIAAFFADIRVELFIESKLVTSLLSAIWIVLIINVFNFLDNMDGASAGIATIISRLRKSLWGTPAHSSSVFSLRC
jgi:UDP-GlcNAc:undecaprenyl-phosphate GlcNAc-1-phosphate transferase